MGGMSSHQSHDSETDSWFTPQFILTALGGVDSFNLDPCSDRLAPWPTARRHYTIEDNGLILNWDGRVFLNPPYSQPAISKFMARMVGHGRGTALIFARTETKVWHDYIWHEAHAVTFLRGRISFCVGKGGRTFKRKTGDIFVPEGGTLDGGGVPSALVAYGVPDARILEQSGLDGRFIKLKDF